MENHFPLNGVGVPNRVDLNDIDARHMSIARRAHLEHGMGISRCELSMVIHHATSNSCWCNSYVLSLVPFYVPVIHEASCI